jgi:hypothetical protein
MKISVLIGITALLITLGCNTVTPLKQAPTEGEETSTNATATVEMQGAVGDQPSVEGQFSGEEQPYIQPQEVPQTPGRVAAQPAECASEVQYQAAPFGDEASWKAYQAHIDRDISTLNDFWMRVYPDLAGGAAYPGVCHVVEYEPQSAPYLAECNLDEQTATQNAFYCSTVNAVMWDGPNFYHPIYQELGDAAVTFITAHEFGHSAQSLSGQSPRRSLNTELQADCYAGAYLQYMNAQGLMSEGDAEEVIAIVFAVGQSRVGTRWLARTHGTPVQREIALRRGFTQGVAGCQADFSDQEGTSQTTIHIEEDTTATQLELLRREIREVYESLLVHVSNLRRSLSEQQLFHTIFQQSPEDHTGNYENRPDRTNRPELNRELTPPDDQLHIFRIFKEALIDTRMNDQIRRLR